MSLILWYGIAVLVGIISLWSLFYAWISLQGCYFWNALFSSILNVISAILFFKMVF